MGGMIKKYLEHIGYLEDDYDPNEIIPLVGLPSGQYLETERKNYSKIQRITNWNDKLKSYTFNDRDYNTLLYLLDITLPKKSDVFTDDDQALDILTILNRLGIKNTYKIDRGNVTLYGDILIENRTFDILPVKIHEVRGNFIIRNGDLKSLKNCPSIVHGNFDCSYNKLNTLKYGPRQVGGYYNCSHNNLISLIGSPMETKTFNCSYNNLTILEYCPSVVEGNFDCSHNKITHILDSPITVSGLFDCRYNRISSLKGLPRDVTETRCQNNPLMEIKK